MVVVVIPRRDHAVEALPEAAFLGVVMLAMREADILAVPMFEVDMAVTPTPEVAILGPEWGLMESGTAGTLRARTPRVETGTAGIGAGATTGTVTTPGTAAAVTGKIRTANGDGGMGTSGVIPGITSSSLATLAFPGGGAGAGVPGPAGAGVIRTVTDIMVTAIPTMAATVIHTTATEMDTARSISRIMGSTETAANPELPSYSGDCPALVITMGPSTGSLGQKRGEQFRPTSRSTAT